MELMQQVKGNYSASREKEEAADIITIRKETESSSLGMHVTDNSPTGHELGLQQQEAASNFGKKLDLMEMPLGSKKVEEEEGDLQEGGVFRQHHPHEGQGRKEVVEKEHMFDKVVTPSDVGKLNRLVIPKQNAEKYFPLDSSSNEKGLLLNFEDRNGKVWRFRYSYWNSSQSYVMTKGWSRFVKEKKLDAGDVVSFQRGLGDLYRHMLYIDWRRRSDHAPDPLFLPSIRWYSLPPTIPPPYHQHDHHFHHLNYNNLFTFQQHQYLGAAHHHNNYGDQNSGSGSLYYLRRSMDVCDQNIQGRGNNIVPMIIDSVPVNVAHRHGATTSSGKRLRLFGVNMECASSAEDFKGLSSGSTTHVTVGNLLPSASSLHHRLRMPHADPLSSSASFGDHKRGTGSSLLFDSDASLQYRH